MEKLLKGDIITIIGISDWMATTTRNTIYATGEFNAERNKPIFKESPKKRTKFTLKHDLENYGPEELVFRGVFPLKLDGEVSRPSKSGSGFSVSTMRGNACINIADNPAVIKAVIESGNINQAFTAYDRIMSISIDGETETPVYPDVPTNSAVVENIRNKQPQHA